MEALLALLCLAGLACGGWWVLQRGVRAATHASTAARARAALHATQLRGRAVAAQRRRSTFRSLNRLARQLQQALLQLGAAPDFRRAASWAERAAAVPVAFRQRQFRRFRPRLVGHFAARLAAGADAAS